MEDSVVLEMLVKRSVADEISQKGLAEIALRRADAKFKAMVKCKVLGDGIKEELSEKIASSAMKLNITDSISMNDIRSTMWTYGYNDNNNIKNIAAATKNLSVQVDNIFRMSNVIRNLSYINTGISLVNLAVDVVGFMVINNKLKTLDSNMKTVTNELRKLTNIAKNEKISVFQKLVMKYTQLSSKIVNSDTVSDDEIENLLIDMRAFISEMFMNLQDNALEKELLLEIIYVLLPAYTQLLNDFIKRTYFHKQCLPANYNNFTSLYEELENRNFTSILAEYFFLNKKMHSQDVIDLLYTQSLMVVNQKVLIEDQASLLKMLGSGEQFDAFELELDKIVKSTLQEKIPVIAKDAGVDKEDCKKFFAFER